MPAGQVVRIKNNSKEDFVGKYDQNVYRVKAGQEAIAPVEASWHWFGRPHAIDGRKKERTDEVNRLNVLYGLFDDESGSIAEKRERNVPKCEVYDLDGERIYTVLDDPKGERINPSDQSAHEAELMNDQIQKLQRELAALTSAAALADTSPDYQPSSDVLVEEVPDDTPTKVPVADGPRRGRVARGS